MAARCHVPYIHLLLLLPWDGSFVCFHTRPHPNKNNSEYMGKYALENSTLTATLSSGLYLLFAAEEAKESDVLWWAKHQHLENWKV
jgi:hypothetical protein